MNNTDSPLKNNHTSDACAAAVAGILQERSQINPQ